MTETAYYRWEPVPCDRCGKTRQQHLEGKFCPDPEPAGDES